MALNLAPTPLTLLGRSQTSVTHAGDVVLVHYGTGAASLLVVERKGALAGPLAALPPVDLGVPAHELQTQLGTIVLWERNGVSFTFAGSVSAADAERAVGELLS